MLTRSGFVHTIGRRDLVSQKIITPAPMTRDFAISLRCENLGDAADVHSRGGASSLAQRRYCRQVQAAFERFTLSTTALRSHNYCIVSELEHEGRR